MKSPISPQEALDRQFVDATRLIDRQLEESYTDEGPVHVYLRRFPRGAVLKMVVDAYADAGWRVVVGKNDRLEEWFIFDKADGPQG